MADIDMSARFETISEKARVASGNLKAARQRTVERLESDANSARDRAAAAADRLNDKATAAEDKASSQWREVRSKWQAHVAKMRVGAKEKKSTSTQIWPRPTPTRPRPMHWMPSISHRGHR
jgi:hypothetical protein